MVNRATLIGRLGADPDAREKVCLLSVATTERYKTASGEPRESTAWHRVSVFGPARDYCEKYLHKGDLVYIEGRIDYSTYEKDGQTMRSTSILARVVKGLSHKSRDGAEGGQDSAPKDDLRERASRTARETREKLHRNSGGSDDEIPF